MTKSMPITVRPAEIFDAPFIIGSQIKMADETEQLLLPHDVVTAGVKAVFADPSKGFYLIAETNGAAVGCLMITPEWSDWRNAWVWWIQSVYVHPQSRKAGVFGTMYDYVKKMVIQRNDVSGIRLYVDISNLAAQEVYKRAGMNGGHYQTFEWMKG